MGKVFQVANGPSMRIKEVSFYIVQDIIKSLPEPQQEMIEVTNPDGEKSLMPDMSTTAKERYQLKLLEFEGEYNKLLMRIALLEGVDVELDEKQLKQVADYRARMKKYRAELELDEDDKFVWIVYITCPNHEELTRLQKAIIGLNQATEEAMQKAAERFRS
jgi:hypothetical protein